jgi:hypothetical protein
MDGKEEAFLLQLSSSIMPARVCGGDGRVEVLVHGAGREDGGVLVRWSMARVLAGPIRDLTINGTCGMGNGRRR